jgi:hypothetical protein
LSFSSVQTSLGKKATNYLNKDFDVDINIKKVDLSFLGSVQLKEILVNSHHGDTLIYIDNLSTSIFSYRKIINNKLDFGEIELEDFTLNLNTYKGEQDDALSIFVDKLDSGEPTDEPSGFLLTSTNLKLTNGYVEIIDFNKPNDNPLFFRNISGKAKNFRIDGPNVSTNIEGLSFVENHNIKVQNFTTNFVYTKQFMEFLASNIKTENSEINADIKFTYNREDFSDFNNKVNIEAIVKKAAVSQIDLKKFYNDLGTDDKLHFSTTINGQLNNFTANNLRLKSNNGAIVNGDLNFKNVFNQENGFSLDARLDNLTSDYKHLKRLLPNVLGNTLPSTFEKLGRFTLVGNTYVTDNLINAQLTINSDLGTTISDLELSNIANIDKASYFGTIKVIDFELGEIIQDSLVGKLSMEAEIDGSGFTLETLNTSVKGKVSKHQYKEYTYSNISINGLFKNKHFDGNMEVNDDNIKLNFKGLADFSKETYVFDFKSVVDYCDFNKLNLFKRDSISNAKGEIDLKLRGNSIDDVVGKIQFNNALYSNQKQDYYFKNFNITSVFEDSIRVITINSSEIIDGRVRGNFKFDEIVKLTQNSIGSIYSNYNPYEVSSGQNLDFRFNIHNKIIEIFFPEVSVAANSTIRGNISSDNGLFKLNIKSPQVIAYKNEINNINLQIDNKNPLFNTYLAIGKINSNIYDVTDFQLLNTTINDTLYFKSEFKGGQKMSENFDLSFYHTFNEDRQSVFGIQKSSVNFKEKEWLVNPNNNNFNKIVYNNKEDSYQIFPFLVASNDQKIRVLGTMNDKTSKDLIFNFEKVKLASITPKIDSLDLRGELNGVLNYKQIQKQVKPTANLSISNFYVNDSYQGNLKLDVEGKNSVTKYDVDITLQRDGYSNLAINGNLDFTPKKPVIDINVDFEEFKLDAFSPLGEDVFTNIRGVAYGSARLTGLLENPTMEGDLFLDKAGMYFPYLNVDYDFEGTSVISLKDQSFIFEDVTLKDVKHQTKGNLTGVLNHIKFDNWNLDLNINTSNLLVLDTEEEENSLYYGTGFLAGNASIEGPTDKLQIEVAGRTNKGTYFVIPISDVKTIESSQIVRFVNENKEQEVFDRQTFISEKLKGLSINFNLEVTKDAVVEMVLDKATGSFLKGSGTGSLQIELDTKDKFNMFGSFIVDNGIYNFKYGGIINKPFSVRSGGSISWSGDPLTADINIEAVYRVSANPRSLLENITASRKIPIDLITRFSGELFNSQREFDIEIPNSSSTVASELAFKLNENDQNRKTVHFMALLATGSFFNEDDFSVNANSFAYGTGTDLLANAFDNIFNQGNNKFKLRPSYTVGERNKVDNIDIYDQLAIDLAYQVNDRVLINGKVGMPIGSKEQSSVIGEVNVEFLMNEEGTLRSSFFNRQNEIQYSYDQEGYTQGVGLSYQIDFDTGKELLQKLGLKKKVVQDSTNIKQQDSIKINNKIVNFKQKKIIKNE